MSLSVKLNASMLRAALVSLLSCPFDSPKEDVSLR